MSIITNEDDAQQILEFLVETDCAPVLDGPTVQKILDNNKRASVWAAATVYSVGDVVIPATRNGHRFVCVVAGTSAATEPGWPSRDNACVSDGSTLSWQEAGVEYDLWDMRNAAFQGWQKKKSKAVSKIDFSSQDTSFRNSQVFEHIDSKLKEFWPIGVA